MNTGGPGADTALYCAISGLLFTLIALLPLIFDDRETAAMWLLTATVMYVVGLTVATVDHLAHVAYLRWRKPG